MEHADKHALVTGGGTGIGRDIAMALANAGATVTITGRRLEVLEAVSHPRIYPLQMDVGDEGNLRDGIAKAAGTHGPIRICVANAGIAQGGPFAKTSLDNWRQTMAINLDGAFLTIQAALATLSPDTPARFIAISSIAGLKGLRNATAYTVSKHGLIGLMRGLSEEYMGKPITFNALCPGYVDTDIVANQLPGIMRRHNIDEDAARALMAEGNRHKTLLNVDEVTAAAMWLCSDGARSVNGQTIEIAGGQV